MKCSECDGTGNAGGVSVSRKCSSCAGTGQVPEDPFDCRQYATERCGGCGACLGQPEPEDIEQTQPNIQLISLVGVVRYSDNASKLLQQDGNLPFSWFVRTLSTPIHAVPIDEFDIDGSPHIIYYHRSGFYAQRKDK